MGGNPAKLIKNRVLIDIKRGGVKCETVEEIKALLADLEKGGVL